MAIDTKVKIAGVWRTISTMYVKIAGVWKETTVGYVKIAGVWKEVFASLFDYANHGFTRAYFYGGQNVTGSPGHLDTIHKWNEAIYTLESATLAYKQIASFASYLNAVNYIFGGRITSGTEAFPDYYGNNTISKYDEVSHTFELEVLPTNLFNSTASFLNDSIYMYGGYNGYVNGSGDIIIGLVNTIHKWTGAAISTQAATVEYAHHHNRAACWLNNYSYLYGGDDNTAGDLATIRQYDEVTSTIVTATLEQGLSSIAVGFLNNVNYIYGGRDADASAEAFVYTIDSIQKYDGVTRTTEIAKLTYKTAVPSLSVSTNFNYIFGMVEAGAGIFDPSIYHTTISSWNGTTYTDTGQDLPYFFSTNSAEL